jgi:hypothetical protein
VRRVDYPEGLYSSWDESSATELAGMAPFSIAGGREEAAAGSLMTQTGNAVGV